MKLWIASVALLGVALGGCSKQTAEGNTPAAEAVGNSDTSLAGDNVAADNGLDAGLSNAGDNAANGTDAVADNATH